MAYFAVGTGLVVLMRIFRSPLLFYYLSLLLFPGPSDPLGPPRVPRVFGFTSSPPPRLWLAPPPPALRRDFAIIAERESGSVAMFSFRVYCMRGVCGMYVYQYALLFAWFVLCCAVFVCRGCCWCGLSRMCGMSRMCGIYASGMSCMRGMCSMRDMSGM